MTITYKFDLTEVDWVELKSTLCDDDFDNGRTPGQLKLSFENSYATCIAYANQCIIGTARVLSDGVCNAYIVDVWTLTEFRKQGIARTMMKHLTEKLPGQHVYLFSDDTAGFYKKLGFRERPFGLEIVMGEWLNNNPLTTQPGDAE